MGSSTTCMSLQVFHHLRVTATIQFSPNKIIYYWDKNGKKYIYSHVDLFLGLVLQAGSDGKADIPGISFGCGLRTLEITGL